MLERDGFDVPAFGVVSGPTAISDIQNSFTRTGNSFTSEME